MPSKNVGIAMKSFSMDVDVLALSNSTQSVIFILSCKIVSQFKTSPMFIFILSVSLLRYLIYLFRYSFWISISDFS